MSPAPVGIVDVATYVPERWVSAAEIAERSGIPAEVIRERFGLEGRHVSRADEHVTGMCVAAARPLVERHGAEGIDAVVYFGSHWKDHLVWNAAPQIQHVLGIEGYSLETINVSAGAPVALKVVADMLAADRHLRSVLMVAASKEGHLVDLANRRARFMLNFGDGAAAVLVRRGHDENRVLASSLYTDGSFSAFVRVPGGGSVHPASRATVEAGMHTLDVTDPAEMKERLDPVTLKNFVRVAREAMERSGFDGIDLLLPIHMKRSIHDAILLELGVPPGRAVYLDRFGHMSAVDPFVGLALARERGMLRDGDRVLMLAAGTGYTWAATALRWGRV